ncbi:MAG: DUF2807 domain-containing protein [Bacteroidetes bacterium]|nr:DUF2807 domain-containing protein [Bacteroidota bacterium]
MNKVIQIRLGHYVLTADEDAARRVSEYTDVLKKRYATEEGGAEIVEDIEERIGELLSQKQQLQNRTYTVLADVEEVLAQIGPAEDEPAGHSAETTAPAENIRRRLFRDPDNKIIGGVCGGLGNYFDMDPLIFRLVWIVSVFVFGFGLPLYIIFWIIVPEAQSTAEKLMMRGQAPTRRNIEENIKAEWQGVADRVRNGSPAMDAFSRSLRAVVKSIGLILMAVFRVAGWVITAVLISLLVVLLLGLTTEMAEIRTPWMDIYGSAGMNQLLGWTHLHPVWVKGILIGFILLAIAVIVLKSMGIARKRPEVKTSVRILGIFTFVLFTAAVVIAANAASRFRFQQLRQGEREKLTITGDTLFLSSSPYNPNDGGIYLKAELEDVLVSPDSNYYISQDIRSFGRYNTQGNLSPSKAWTLNANVLNLETARKLPENQNQGLQHIRFTIYVPAGKKLSVRKDWYFASQNSSGVIGPSSHYAMGRQGYLSQGGHPVFIGFGEEPETLEAAGNFDVRIVQDEKNGLELVSGPVLQHQDWVEIENGRVHLESHGLDDDHQKSVVVLHTRHLNRLQLSGACKAGFNQWQADALQIDCEGACGVTGILNVKRLQVDMDGACEFHPEGQVGHFQSRLTGACAILGERMECETVRLDMEGAGKATVWATLTIEADLSGVSELGLKGNPRNNQVRTSGTARYRRL